MRVSLISQSKTVKQITYLRKVKIVKTFNMFFDFSGKGCDLDSFCYLCGWCGKCYEDLFFPYGFSTWWTWFGSFSCFWQVNNCYCEYRLEDNLKWIDTGYDVYNEVVTLTPVKYCVFCGKCRFCNTCLNPDSFYSYLGKLIQRYARRSCISVWPDQNQPIVINMRPPIKKPDKRLSSSLKMIHFYPIETAVLCY